METLAFTFVTDYFPPYVGGVPLHQWEVASRLAKRGHAVEVVTCRLPRTKAREGKEGVQIHRVGWRGAASRYAFLATALPAVRRLARRSDALQASTFIAAGPGSWAAHLGHCPSLLTIHEVFGPDWRTYVRNPVVARSLQAAEAFLLRQPFEGHVAVSDYTAQRLLRQSRGRIQAQVIHPGVDTSFWRPVDGARARGRERLGVGDRFTYLFYGRAGISKGVLDLLEAAEAFARLRPKSRLVLVLAPGEVEAQAWRRIQGSPTLREHVILRRGLPREDLRDAVLSADCVVVPSLAEGFGFSAAEPTQAGVPVIATRAGALPEVVGGRHLLVPPGQPSALVEALLRAEQGDWDVAPVPQFSWEETASAYERVLSGLSGTASDRATSGAASGLA